MPLTDVDPNVSSRNSLSKASNFSGKTSHKDGQGIAPSSTGSSNPAGVFSMLKTTTELGDIGTFVNQNRVPRRPGPPRRPSNLTPSGASSHYSRAGSIRSQASSTRSKQSNGDRSMPGAWPYRQHPQPGSVDALLPDSRSFTAQHRSNSIASTTDRFDLEPRSYSLTTASRPPGARGLSNHPSLVSLRNASNLMSRPRSPYNHPSRLRRPGHRPGSPALSDTMGAAPYNRPYTVRPSVGTRSFTASPVQYGDPREYAQGRDQAYYEPPLRPYNSNNGFRQVHQPPLVRQHPDYSQDFHTSSRNFQASEVTGEAFGYPGRPPPPFRPSPSPLSNDSSPSVPTHSIRPPVPYDGPHVGFVQRVKQALEEKASTDEFSRRPSPPMIKKSLERPERSAGDDVTEQPASPEVKRLTRDMIKAAVGPPSDTGAMSPDDAAGSVVSISRPDSSSAEDSSIHARSSEELPASCSTPELQNSGSSVAHTVLSSVDENMLAEDGGDASAPKAIPKSTDGVSFSTSIPVTKLQATPTVALEAPRSDHDGFSRTDTSLQVTHLPSKISKRPMTMPSSSPPRDTIAQVDRQSLPTRGVLQRRQIPLGVVEARPDENLARQSIHISISDMGDDEESTIRHDISAPPSARSSFHSISRPESTTDPLTWASSSIMARRSFNPDCSRRSSPLTVAEAHQVPRMSLAAPTAPSTGTAYVHEYPLRQSMASVEVPSAMQPTPASEPRISAIKQFHFPMPDLTEDSQEDASTTNLRMLGSRPHNFRSGPHKKARRDTRQPPRAEPSPKQEKPPASYLSTKLADTKSMPSLNFSHNDLTTKLNLALGLSSHRSLEELKRLTTLDHENDTPELKVTKAELRERYKSFFSGAEESEEIPEPTSVVTDYKISKPNAFIDELDQLSIPSVHGLTVRLSEILPSIKKGDYSLDITKSDAALGDTVDKIRDLGSLELTTSLECKRASLLSALSAGAFAQSRRSGGTSGRDKAQRENGNANTNKELPMLPTEGKDPRPSTATVSKKRSLDANDDTNSTRRCELEATVPIELPIGSEKQSSSQEQDKSSQINPKLKVYSHQEIDDALREHGDSDPSSDGDPTVEVPVPSRHEANKLSTAEPKSHLRRSRSVMESAPDQIEHAVRSMSPGPQMQKDLIPASEETDNQVHDQRGRKGIIGSIQRKIGARKTRSDRTDWHLDPIFLHPEERTVTGPGDRYPTTSLSPPSHGHIDDGRSYFSDDSSLDGEARTGVLRKRLTRLKNRHSQQQQSQRRVTSRAFSARNSHQSGQPPHAVWMRNESPYSRDSQTGSTHPDVVMVYDDPPAGMTKFEFRMKRILEKLRILWCRSGEAVRSMSRNRKQYPPTWYEGSEVYDGT